jgi:plastocyanin
MLRVAVSLLVVASLSGCGDSTGPAEPVETNQVAVRDDFFNPSNAQVVPGSTVTWTWSSGDAHDVAFEDNLGSSALQTSGTHTRTFAAAGTYRYRCTAHSTSFTNGMIGQVIVQ